MSQPVRIGVIGVGALGQHHARVYASLPGATLAGVHDAKPERAREVAAQYGGVAYEDLQALLGAVDAVSLAVPTLAHHRLAKVCLEAGKDVLVEKPMTSTLAEADDLIATAARHGRLLQVGHVERFNPAVDVIRSAAPHPRFIEVHRLGAFPGRSLDIDVVLDLMIHDLDIILSLESSDPLQIDAVGVPVLTPKVDIANARLRFASGLIANLTASRVSGERVRKFRVFAQGTYVSADLATREARVYRLVSSPAGARGLEEERVAAPDEEPLRRQLAAFVHSTQTRAPVVSGAEGRRALALACRILEQMDPRAGQ